MQYTEFYQFRKPTKALDVVKVGDINYNSDLMDELIHSTQISLAPAYDETRTSADPYNTGDVVMKDALMYKCKEDGIYGAWDATKWERTTAGEEGAGGSNVEANPQGTPTDDLDTIGINGTIYNIAGSGGGGGNVYGAFVDTNRVIQASTNLTGDDTYTAVEDCAVFVQANGNTNNSVRVLIDNAQVGGSWSPNIYGFVDTFYVKRGQTIRILATLTSDYGAYTVYGLTFGTQNIFTPQIYSTEERCVGVWIDNKPLYAKTIECGALPNNSAKNVQTLDNTWRVVGVTGVAISSTDATSIRPLPFPADSTNTIRVDVSTGVLKITTFGTWSGYDGLVTLLYTKTTDVAGSGSYNTLGVPMVHYTTDEQVVGTYLGNTLYQKTIIFPTPQSIASDAWYTFDSGIANIENISRTEVVDSSGNCIDCVICSKGTGTNLALGNVGRSNITGVEKVTIWYTKSSS